MRSIPHLYQSLWLAALSLAGLWQFSRPVHQFSQPLLRRWLVNGSLFVLARFASALILTGGAVAMAVAVSASPIGLLNRPAVPYAVRFGLALLALDLARYLRHSIYHSTAIGWRIHQVHHSDPDFDMSTGLRFHPIEDLLTGLTDIAVVALLAPPALAVATGEAIAIVSNLLIHANASLPERLEPILRRCLVTPDVHRVHHAAEMADQNTNFGIVFSFWDHLRGTFRARPTVAPEHLQFGLSEMRGTRAVSLPVLLALPFQDFAAGGDDALDGETRDAGPGERELA